MRLRILGATLILMGTVLVSPALSQTAVYDSSQFENQSNVYQQHFGAALINGKRYTAAMLDDISAVDASGTDLNAIYMAFGRPSNFTGTLNVDVTVSVFNNNGTSSGPGTLLATSTLSSLSIDPGPPAQLYEFLFPGQQVLPDDTLWVGLTFSSSTLSASQLGQFGWLAADSITTGSSNAGPGGAFRTSSASDLLSSNPAGNTFDVDPSGSRDDNFVFRVEVNAVTAPEPGTIVFLLLGGVCLTGRHRIRRMTA